MGIGMSSLVDEEYDADSSTDINGWVLCGCLCITSFKVCNVREQIYGTVFETRIWTRPKKMHCEPKMKGMRKKLPFVPNLLQPCPTSERKFLGCFRYRDMY